MMSFDDAFICFLIVPATLWLFALKADEQLAVNTKRNKENTFLMKAGRMILIISAFASTVISFIYYLAFAFKGIAQVIFA